MASPRPPSGPAPRPKPTHVLVLSEIAGLLDALQAAVPPEEAEFFASTLANATKPMLMCYEVIVADPPTFARLADQCTSGALRWVQSTYAGVDALVRHSAYRGYQCTRLAGVFGQAMSEYVMMHVLALERRLLRDRELQARAEWGTCDALANATSGEAYRLLPSLTLGVLGFGDIGRRVGEVAAAMGMRVWICNRRSGRLEPSDAAMWEREAPRDRVPAFVDRAFGAGDQLREFLGGCDYVVNLLPSTPETRGLLTASRLRACKDGAALINVGRGDVFGEERGEDEIMAALDAPGGLRHAVLDVHAPVEPLPADSFLWRHPKVTVTPHNAARSFPRDVAKAFAANLTKFRDGQKLDHLVDWNRGY